MGCFLVGALIAEDRRRSAAALVEEYLGALELPASARVTAQEAWLRYRATPGVRR